MSELERLAGLLAERIGRRKLAVAESCTGGRLGDAITSVSGSSDYFVGGVICYSNEVKNQLLEVPRETLDKWGAVSPQVAEAMAVGVRGLLKADLAVAVSGIAGPGGGGEKPVGLVFISVAGETETFTEGFNFSGTRFQIKEQSAMKALESLLKVLTNATVIPAKADGLVKSRG